MGWRTEVGNFQNSSNHFSFSFIHKGSPNTFSLDAYRSWKGVLRSTVFVLFFFCMCMFQEMASWIPPSSGLVGPIANWSWPHPLVRGYNCIPWQTPSPARKASVPLLRESWWLCSVFVAQTESLFVCPVLVVDEKDLMVMSCVGCCSETGFLFPGGKGKAPRECLGKRPAGIHNL